MFTCKKCGAWVEEKLVCDFCEKYEDAKKIIIMNFPMLQGSSNHTRFKNLGISNFNQDKVKNAVKYLESNNRN